MQPITKMDIFASRWRSSGREWNETTIEQMRSLLRTEVKRSNETLREDVGESAQHLPAARSAAGAGRPLALSVGDQVSRQMRSESVAKTADDRGWVTPPICCLGVVGGRKNVRRTHERPGASRKSGDARSGPSRKVLFLYSCLLTYQNPKIG